MAKNFAILNTDDGQVDIGDKEVFLDAWYAMNKKSFNAIYERDKQIPTGIGMIHELYHTNNPVFRKILKKVM